MVFSHYKYSCIFLYLIVQIFAYNHVSLYFYKFFEFFIILHVITQKSKKKLYRSGRELEYIFSYKPKVSFKIHNFFNHHAAVPGLHKFVFAFIQLILILLS